MAVIWYDTVDSTNAEVLRRADELDNLSVIAAREQTAGRGQRGNTWTSAPGENLTFSVLLRHPAGFPPSALIRVNWLAAVSVRDFLRSEGVEAVIKWPNDIYVGRRKICGILIENRTRSDRESLSVIGIGLNLNQTEFPSSLPNPTSFRLLTGRTLDLPTALERFMACFVISTERSEWRNLSSDSLYARYADGLFQAGIPCPYRDLRTGEVFTGTIRGIDDIGRLRVASVISSGGEAEVEKSYGFKDIGYIL